MSRQLKVVQLPLAQLGDVLRGTLRLRLPFDAAIVGIAQSRDVLGLCVCSATYPPSAEDQPLPLVPAVLHRAETDRVAA